MLLLIIFTLFLTSASPSFGFKFSKCVTGPVPTAVRMQGCSDTCQFAPGDVMLTQVDIKPSNNVTTLKGDLFAFETNHLLDDSDGCSHLLNSKCPIEKDTLATYAFNTTIPTKLLGKLPIHFTLTDQTVTTVACFDMEISVIAKAA